MNETGLIHGIRTATTGFSGVGEGPPLSLSPEVLGREAFHRRTAMAVTMVSHLGGGVALVLMHLPGERPAGVHPASLIRNTVRLTDSVAELDDGVFAILLSGAGREAALRAVCKIGEALGKACPGMAAPLAGVALYPEHAPNAESLLELGREALQLTGDNERVVMAEARLMPEHLVRERLPLQVGHALQLQHFHAEYQPVVAMHNGIPVMFEALARWKHPELGQLPPADFLAQAESAEHCEAFNFQLLDQALRQLALWRGTRMPQRVSVNLSASLLELEGIERMILARVLAAGLGSHQLVLEVADSALGRLPERSARALFRIAATGVALCVDDFGRGDGSLHALRELPFEILKFEGAFSADAAQPRTETGILEGLLQMGRKLGKQLIAKNVESEAQRAKLLALGCEFGQGYLFGSAMSPETCERWHPER